MQDLRYSVFIRPLTKDEGGGYFVEVPDLKGCHADGETIEEALKEIEDAMHSWIQTSKECNDCVPAPSVSQMPQFNIRLPKTLQEDLFKKAKSEGIDLNSLIVSILSGISQNKSQVGINKKQ